MNTSKPTRRPTGHIAPFGLRLQPELKARLEAAAVMSGRSMNSEITERLTSSFLSDSPERALKTIEIQTRIISLVGRYLGMMTELAKTGNPTKLEQILLIEALAKTLENGDYEAGMELTDTMLNMKK